MNKSTQPTHLSQAEKNRLYARSYWEKHRERQREISKRVYNKRREAALLASKLRRENDKERTKLTNRIYRTKNKEKIAQKIRQRYLLNREKILLASKRWKESNKERVRLKNKEYRTRKLREDPLYIAKTKIRQAVGNCFRRIKKNKPTNTEAILGCSYEEAKNHFESLFVEGMDWSNHGVLWVIDHIKPVASFAEDDFHLANHINNLQPLLWKDNNQKSSWYNGINYRSL